MDTTYAVALVVTAVLGAAVIVVAWRRRPAPGAFGVAAIGVVMVLWAFASSNAVSWIDASAWDYRYWSLMSYVGTLLLPACILVTALEYSGRTEMLNPSLYGALAVEPIVTMVALSAGLRDSLPRSTDSLGPGAGQSVWFWAHTVYVLSVTAVALALLAGEVSGRPRIIRHQTRTLMAAASIPSVFLVVGSLSKGIGAEIDFTPLAFTLMGLLLVFNLLRLDLFLTVPVARDQLIDQMSTGVLVVDTRDRVIDMNPAALGLVGLSDLRSGSDVEQVVPGWDGLIREACDGGGCVHVEPAAVPRRVVEVTALPVAHRPGGENVATLVSLQDVTHAVHSQRALEESERRFARIIAGAALGSWDWDLRTDKVVFNDHWFEMLGYSPHEMPHELDTWRQLIHPDDRMGARSAVEEHLTGHAPEYEYAHRLRRKDGEWVWVLDRGRIVERDEEGEPVRMAGTHLDVTDRILAEQALRRSERMVAGLAETTRHLLAGATLSDAHVAKALAVLGASAGVDRVYIFEQENDPEGGRGWCSQRFEWAADGTEPQIGNPLLQHLPWEDVAPRWYDAFIEDWHIAGDTEDFPPGEREALEPQGILSVLVLPIWSAGRLWGFIGFDSCRQTRRWETQEVALLRATANSFGAALERSRITASEHEQRVFAEVLRDAVSAMSDTLDVEGVLDGVFDSINRVAECDATRVVLMRDGHPTTVRSRGYEHVSVSEAFDSAVVESMRSTLSARFEVDTYADKAHWGTGDTVSVVPRSFAASPIFVRDQLMGFISIESGARSRFAYKHAAQMRALADSAAVAIDNARLHEQLKEQAITDELTGVFNRRGLVLHATREFERARRLEAPMAVAIIDADHFKRINDEHGHVVGDQVLRHIAQTCIANVRATEVVARFGGDEFVVLLPETTGEQAALVAQRIRDALASHALDAGPLGRVPATVCVGVASEPASESSLDSLLTAADQALYRAKESGRDRVVQG